MMVFGVGDYLIRKHIPRGISPIEPTFHEYDDATKRVNLPTDMEMVS